MGLQAWRWVALLSVVSTIQAQTAIVDSAAAQKFEAHATSVIGQVSRIRDQQPWALSAGERVPIRQLITTGRDGYAHFDVAGGSNFDIYSNSRLVFRENAASAGDLLDLQSGRVRIHLQPAIGQAQLRVLAPAVMITSSQPGTLAIAIDEDDIVRIDVLEGEVRVQHTLLPRGEPVVVRAIDAIIVQRDEPISRRVDRGSLYRYTIKPFKDALSAITPGKSTGHNLLANRLDSDILDSRFQTGTH